VLSGSVGPWAAAAGEQSGLEAARPVGGRGVDAERPGGGCRGGPTRLEATHGRLAQPCTAGEPLLGEIEELAHAPHALAEPVHPTGPVAPLAGLVVHAGAENAGPVNHWQSVILRKGWRNYRARPRSSPPAAAPERALARERPTLRCPAGECHGSGAMGATAGEGTPTTESARAG